MTVAPRPSTRRLLLRFTPRDVLSRDQAVVQHWHQLPRPAVDELLNLLEEEFGVPGGFFRPDDLVAHLTTPFPLGNPFSWLWAEGALEDGASELNYRLSKRLEAAGITPPERLPATFKQLAELWCTPAT